MRFICVLIPLVFATNSLIAQEVEVEPEFEIDGASKRASLLFVTGMSYGISFLNNAYENAGVRVGICLPDSKEYIGAGEIVEILNDNDEDAYSADEATNLVVSALARKYPCN